MGWKARVGSKWKQILYSLIVASALIGTGTVVGWSVEVSRIIEDPEKSFNVTVTDQEWLVSSVGVAAIFSSLLSGYLVELIGPCRLMHVLLMPFALFWIVMAAADSYKWIIAGRVVTGTIGQMFTAIVQPLIAEMCQADIRGMMSALPELAISFGMLLLYVFARTLTWQAGTLIAGIILFPVIGVYFFVPESPYWFIRKGNYAEAQRSLKKIRPNQHDVESELSIIRESVVDLRQTQGTFKEQILSMKEPANYRPTILLCGLFILRELGGAVVIFMYSAFFFQNAGVPFDPFTATILVGVTRLLFTIISAFFIDFVGRRILFVSTSCICSLMMYATGIILRYPVTSFSWLPLAMVLIFVASYGLGPGPVPWILVGEMLPTPVRSVASSICVGLYSLVLFFQIQFFPQLLFQFGLGDILIGFASFHLLAAIVAWLFLPETKNRTLEELQTVFAGAALRPFRKYREGYLQTYGSTFSTKKEIK